MEVTHLATLVSNLGPIALKKLNRVHRYLFGTVNKPVYFGTSHIELEIFADASYASHPQTMRSHGGFLVRIGKDSGAIYSKSKEQSMVTTSSCEAELLQLTNAVKQSLQVMKLLMELNCISKSFLRVYQDNASTIQLAFNGEGYSGKAKHFRVRFHFLKELVDAGNLEISYCPTNLMIADFLLDQATSY